MHVSGSILTSYAQMVEWQWWAQFLKDVKTNGSQSEEQLWTNMSKRGFQDRMYINSSLGDWRYFPVFFHASISYFEAIIWRLIMLPGVYDITSCYTLRLLSVIQLKHVYTIVKHVCFWSLIGVVLCFLLGTTNKLSNLYW